MIICTTATLSHVPNALQLARSARNHFPHVKIVLGLVEDQVPDVLHSSPWIDQIILAKDLPIPDFNRFIFRLTVPLSQNSIKAQLLHHLMEIDAQADILVYADCFTRFFGPIPEALQLLKSNPIVLVPHLIDVHFTESYGREMSLLNDGTFHSGFIVVKRSDEAEDFLEWWSDKLNRDIRDPYASNFFDQKWLNFANVFYQVGILRHAGYQLGFWNFHEESRHLVSMEENNIVLKGGGLRHMNFGNENNSFDYFVNHLPGHQSHNMRLLKQLYEADVLTHDHHGFKHAEWSYARFKSKEMITEESRLSYRNLKSELATPNPFELSNQQLVQK